MLVHRYSKVVCQVLVARHCMGRHCKVECQVQPRSWWVYKGSSRPTAASAKAVFALGKRRLGCRHAYCLVRTYAQSVRARCVKICTRCAHMLAAGALSRLLHRLPFLSRLRRSAQVTMVVNSCALGCAQVCSWVVRYTAGLCVIRVSCALYGWVMKRWLAPINRVREVLHPLECTT